MGDTPTTEYQRDNLQEALDEIRDNIPNSAYALLTTSDQNDGYGFILDDVVLTDGRRYSDVDAEHLRTVQDDLYENLCDLDWNGVVGEDDHGDARIALAPAVELVVTGPAALPDGSDPRMDGGKLADLPWDGDGRWRNTLKPEDITHDNTRRAGFAVTGLTAFAEETGAEDENIVSDFLCDLMHLCDALSVDLTDEMDRARVHYTAELRGVL